MNKMNKYNLEVGDIVLDRDFTFIALAIRWFMNIYRKKGQRSYKEAILYRNGSNYL